MDVKPILYSVIKNRVVQHVGFWVIYSLMASFIFSYQSDFPYYFYLINYLLSVPVYAGFTYFTVYTLIPRLLLKKRVFSFLFSFFPVSVLASFMSLVINHFVFFRYFIPEVFYPDEWITVKLLIQTCFWLWTPAMLFAAIKYLLDLDNARREQMDMERKRLEAELQQLKAQLHPHFLFNTLNNLYVLALQKSDKTPDIILKISDLFHYILYECNSREVPIEKELNLIRNYIDLEQLRYGDRLKVTLETNGDLSNAMVAPMLFFTFVENCFKHGSSKDPGEPWIQLIVKTGDDELFFHAENSKPPRNLLYDNRHNGGVGLQNIKKRLDLLYPGKHRLKIANKPDVFVVDLCINESCETVI